MSPCGCRSPVSQALGSGKGSFGLLQVRLDSDSGLSCRWLAQHGNWAFALVTGLLFIPTFFSLVWLNFSDPGILHRGEASVSWEKEVAALGVGVCSDDSQSALPTTLPLASAHFHPFTLAQVLAYHLPVCQGIDKHSAKGLPVALRGELDKRWGKKPMHSPKNCCYTHAQKHGSLFQRPELQHLLP